MLSALIYFYKILISPDRTFEKIREEKPFYPSLIYLTLYGFISYIYFSINYSNFVSQIFSELPSTLQSFKETIIQPEIVRSPLLIIIFVVFPFFSTFITSSIIDLLSQSIYKKSNGLAVFSSISFASAPKFVLSLFSVIVSLIFKSQVTTILTLIIIFWNTVLYLYGISKSYEITIFKAFTLVILPFISIILVISLYLSLVLSIFRIPGL